MEKNNGSHMKIPDSIIKRKLKNIHKTFTPYEKKLTLYYGDDFATRTIEHARIEYGLLLPQTPYFEGKVNIFNAVIVISPVIVAFYKAMKANGKTVNDVGRILCEVMEESQNAIPGVMRWVARKFIFSPFFFKISRISAEHVHPHPEGWKIDYLKGDGASSDWYFQCTECGVIKYFRKHGAEELSRYCNYVDYIQSNAFGMGMQNPKNIGQGDEVCLEYMQQGRETVMPENLKMLFHT